MKRPQKIVTKAMVKKFEANAPSLVKELLKEHYPMTLLCFAIACKEVGVKQGVEQGKLVGRHDYHKELKSAVRTITNIFNL